MYKKFTTRKLSTGNFKYPGYHKSNGDAFLSGIDLHPFALKALYLLLLVFAISNTSFSQSQPVDYRQQLNMPTVLPASPDAASIEKFGNFPVSYTTGVPDISIPLYAIKCGSLNWPISLSYHAGGIRVDEIASSAGLGWSVIAPGVISRSRAGRHDEESPGEPNYDSISTSNYQYLYDVLKGTADSEQDIFNFNFNGRSGKFVINQDGSILQIPLSNLKITYVRGSNSQGMTSFTITDENGITYLFDQQESTAAQGYPSESVATSYYSSWYLTKVELPDKKNMLQFSYVGAGQSDESFPTFSQAVGKKYYTQGTGTDQLVYLGDLNERSSSNYVVHTGIMKLTSVNFPNGSIVFTYDAAARQDIGTNVTNKLSAITINQVVNSVTTQLKKYTLYQSYFFNDGSNNSRLYRLRLDSLAEFGSNNTSSPKKYKFEYNSTQMVPRENYGQDIWGYNNGKSGNTSLLQSESVTFNDGAGEQTFQIGDLGNSRAVDTIQMKACMLSAITYPTGGKTTFTFEVNVFSAEQNLTSASEQQTHVAGNQSYPQVSTTNFTFPSGAITADARVIVDMSKYDFKNVTNPSWVSITDLTTATTIYTKTQIDPYQPLYSDEPIGLRQGHNYELKAYVYSSSSDNSELTASIKLRWDNQTSVPDIRKGGGLRIREIKNYSATGVLAGTETYLYDTACTLTYFNAIQRTYSEVKYRLGYGLGNCAYKESPFCRIYSSSPAYAISTAMGSPMLYRRVQKITTDPVTGATNGMSEYRYDVYRDEVYPIGGKYILVPFLSNDWMNGSLISETHYKVDNGTYSVVKEIEYKYGQHNTTMSHSLRVQNNYIREGCEISRDASSISSDAFWYTFPIRSGSKRLMEQIETVYDVKQNKIETHTYNYYNSIKYDFPTKTTLIDSKGNSKSVTYARSPDFSAAGNVYEKMEQSNIIAPVIEQKSYKNDALLNTVRSNYRDWKNDGKIIALDTIQASSYNTLLETRLRYYSYDIYGNPLAVSKDQDVQMSYIWGYQSTHPLAQVTNADNNSIAYTSFETNEGGGWSGITVPGYSHNGSVTGRKSWTQNNFSFSKSGLRTTATYIVTYWSKSGAYSVNGSTATSLKTLNGWTLYQHTVTNPTSGTITVIGSGSIDELRLYPATAQMKTYTYEPLIGVTSECDVNNHLVYYYYDAFSRLALVKDEYGNILKKISYNYYNQPENTSFFGNTIQSNTYIKGCPIGTVGSYHTYTVPANMFYSETQSDANSLSQADMDASGQAYADANGTCSVVQDTIPIQNSVNMGYTVSFNNTSVTVGPKSSTSITVTGGNFFNVSIQPMSNPPNATFIVNGFNTYSTSGASAAFSNVYIGSSGSVQIK